MASITETLNYVLTLKEQDFVTGMNKASQSEDKFQKENNQTQKELNETQKELNQTGKQSKVFSNIIGGIAVASVGRFGLKLAENVDNLAKFSAAIGINVADLNGFATAASLAGVETDKFGLATARLELAVGQAVAGVEKYEKLFNQLGITLFNTNGEQKEFNEIAYETLKALESIENPTERLTILYQIFGRNAFAVNKILDAGVDAFFEQGQAMAENSGITEETAAVYETFNDNLTKTKKELIDMLVLGLEPVFNFINENWQLVLTLTKAFSLLVASLLGVRIAQFAVNTVMIAFNGIMVVGKTVIVGFTLAQKAWTVATKAATAAQVALDIALSPLILTVGAFILVIIKVIVVIKWWIDQINELKGELGLFGAFLSTFVERLEIIFSRFENIIQTLFIKPFLFAIDTIQTAYQSFLNWLDSVFGQGIVNIFTFIGDSFYRLFVQPIESGLEFVQGLFNNFLNFLASIQGSIESFFAALNPFRFNVNDFVVINPSPIINGQNGANNINNSINEVYNITTSQPITNRTIYEQKKMKGLYKR